MPHRVLRCVVAALSAVTVSAAVTACGSDSLGLPTHTSAPTVHVNPSAVAPVSALEAKVPAKIRKQSTLRIAADASYAPNEFLAGDGKTVEGMDIDLITAATRKLGLKADVINASFASIILGVTSGKYDAGVSSFTITNDRMRQVTMVSYFTAGSLWVTKKGNPQHVDSKNACGHTIGVQKGTTQLDELQTASKKCTSSGKKAIHLVIEQNQSKVTADLISGKVDAMAADSPVALYAIQQTGTQLAPLGKTYATAPYGVVLPKRETKFGAALAAAFRSLQQDGTYHKILAKWANASGATTTFAVNPDVND